WVHQCDEEHTNMRCQVAEAPLPARVLDIKSASPEGIALYESKGEFGRYATLSHVWGTTNPFETKKTNIETHKNGIDIGQLPPTFSDAITLARMLDICYLWIDALCICQDDDVDWSREAANMANIYSNACIMLSATGSEDDSEGLPFVSSKRSPPIYETFECTTNGTVGNVHAFSILREVAAFPRNDVLLRDEPLSQRGWALQERWLTHLILHFGSKQMFFEC
ncbi:HET-domain-containing protein, partial [Clathrospora elynae]